MVQYISFRAAAQAQAKKRAADAALPDEMCIRDRRRTVANEACDNGLISVNGKAARASYEVKVGDQISLRFGQRTLTVEVLSVQETVKQSDAGTLYREIAQ